MQEEICKLYIEPTSHCNLSCPMCSRNYWVDEKKGHMHFALFEKTIAEVKGVASIRTIFFGGIGEPLVHPDILAMIHKAKDTGKNIEMITNGVLLDEKMSVGLIDAGLDRIWISIDSIDGFEYENIRRGADYQSVSKNIECLNRARQSKKSRLKLGTSFVLMKKNAGQLPMMHDFARKFNIQDIKITNLIPNTPEMLDQTLYTRSLSLILGTKTSDVNIDLPMLDIVDETKEPLFDLLKGYANFSMMGADLSRKSGYCRFVQEGNVFVRWDGEVCPCMALLHSAKTYLYEWERAIKCTSFGNMQNQKLSDIWFSKGYSAFRERVKEFNFSPCTVCGGCNELDTNQTDCFGTPFPACGGCLWAQGFIQCP